MVVTRSPTSRRGHLCLSVPRRPLGDAWSSNGLLWHDEIRDIERGIAPAPADVDEDELAAALAFVDSLSVDELGGIPDLADHYAQALAELVDAKEEAASVYDQLVTAEPALAEEHRAEAEGHRRKAEDSRDFAALLQYKAQHEA
ncbi:Ku family protein [Streptomyces coeruleorubidus]|uniref:hypothetical protein n=1 Tax=Streptomyces coeruleorubidus TaxID=116188 RepID=UPI0036581671